MTKAKAKPAGARAATVTELRKQLAVAQREVTTRDKALARAAEQISKLDAEPKPGPPPASLAELAAMPMPDDPLAAQAHLFKILAVSVVEALGDPKITSEQRRKEIRTIAAAATKMFPDARRWEADQLIKGDRAELEKKSKERRVAKLERLKR